MCMKWLGVYTGIATTMNEVHMVFLWVISSPTRQRYWVQSSHWFPSVCQQKAVCPLWPWWTPPGFQGPSPHTSPRCPAGTILLLNATQTTINIQMYGWKPSHKKKIFKKNKKTNVHWPLHTVFYVNECHYPDATWLVFSQRTDLHKEFNHKNSDPTYPSKQVHVLPQLSAVCPPMESRMPSGRSALMTSVTNCGVTGRK